MSGLGWTHYPSYRQWLIWMCEGTGYGSTLDSGDQTRRQVVLWMLRALGSLPQNPLGVSCSRINNATRLGLWLDVTSLVQVRAGRGVHLELSLELCVASTVLSPGQRSIPNTRQPLYIQKPRV